MTKRILSVWMALCLCLTLLPTALADNQSGGLGENPLLTGSANSTTHTRSDLTLDGSTSAGTLATDGYAWDHTTRTLQLQDITAGTITLPTNGTVAITIQGEVVVEGIQFSSTSTTDTMTITGITPEAADKLTVNTNNFELNKGVTLSNMTANLSSISQGSGSGVVKLDNAVVEAGSISITDNTVADVANYGLALVNSSLTVTDGIFCGRITMDDTSELILQNGGIKNYGNIPTGMNGLGSYLADGLTIGQYIDPTGNSADKPYTVLDSSGEPATGFTLKKRYMVTFYADGGAFSDGTSSKLSRVDPNATVSQPGNVTKTGHTLTGWYLYDTVNNTLASAAYDFNTPVMADITLKAVWTEDVPNTPSTPNTPNIPVIPPLPPYTGGIPNTTPDAGTITKKNPDGSTTTTVTNQTDGTVTETTTFPDGSSKVVETKRDGTVTTTHTTANKTITVTVTDKDGNVTKRTVSISDEDAVLDERVLLPLEGIQPTDSENAAVISVEIPENTTVTVEIPVENMTPGTVIILVNEDGTETVVSTTKMTENGVAITLSENVVIKIVENSREFHDVSPDDYYSDAVDFASSRGITGGTSGDDFSPDADCGRGQLVTFLWRAAGQPDANGNTKLDDVTEGAYYDDAVQWAAELGIVSGYGEGQFGTDDTVTREQVATILYRFARNMKMDTTQTGSGTADFADSGDIAEYAQEAMIWAVNAGIMQGDNGKLMPDEPCTRAQIVTMLYRLLGA